jgi:hypothetical protein
MTLGPSDVAILDRRVRPLISTELIAEHREDPLAEHGHGAALTEVLHFLRRNPDPSRPRYLLLKSGAPPNWQIAARGPHHDSPVLPVDDVRYPTRAAAEHAVFLRRLNDYGLSDGRGREATVSATTVDDRRATKRRRP